MSAKELRAFGAFSAAELKEANFDVAACVAAGYSLADCRAAGFTAAEARASGVVEGLGPKGAGYAAAELKAAGFSCAEVKANGFAQPAELHAAGFTEMADFVGLTYTYGELCSTGKPDGKPFSSQQLVAHIVAAGQPEWAAFTEDLSLAHPEWRSFHGSI